MKTLTKAAAGIAAMVLAISLSGCGGGSSATTDERSTASQSQSTSTAEVDDGENVATDELSHADEKFLAYVRSETLPATVIADASDAELIAAGHEGCEQVKAGVPLEEIRLVDGEEPTAGGYYMDTSAIFSGAQLAYCPETIPDLG